MKKKIAKRLTLSPEIVRNLSLDDLVSAVGGITGEARCASNPCTDTCPSGYSWCWTACASFPYYCGG
jgi:hypothetical protein